MRWDALILVMAALFLALFLPLYCYQADIHEKTDISIDEVIKSVKPGDILMSATVGKHVSKHRFTSNIISIGNSWKDYHHISIVVEFRNAPHVFEVRPYNMRKICPMIYSENPKSTEKNKVSGFIPLREYLHGISAKFLLRRAKTPFDNARLLDVCRQIDKTCTTASGSVSNWMLHQIQPKKPLNDNSGLTCIEGVAAVLQQYGIKHDGFFRGMAMHPFLEQSSPIYEDKILRIENNEFLNW